MKPKEASGGPGKVIHEINLNMTLFLESKPLVDQKPNS